MIEASFRWYPHGANSISQLSMMTDESQSRHLALVFFDVLVLDDEPLIFQAYATRRQILETYIKPIPSKAVLSERYQIDMFGPDPHKALQTIFAENLGDHLEGLILKADESEYNEFRLPWVKLKQDYIQGFGDCVDLIVVSAGWDRDRARELRGERKPGSTRDVSNIQPVMPSVYTTFYVGAITNVREVQVKVR
jgi:DNA ligase-4